MTETISSRFPDRFAGLFIPREIWELDLPLPQKVLLAEIRALADLQKEKGCFASNAHFSALLDVNDRTVRKHITALENAGHLRAEGRGGKRRRMWMERPEAPAPTAPAAQDESRQYEAISATDSRKELSNGRHSHAADPGTSCNNPAKANRSTRRRTATEDTMREQTDSPNEKPTEDSDGFPLPSWMHESDWRSWMDYNREAGRTLGQTQMKAHIASLQRLLGGGHPPDHVIRHAIECGYKNFYPLPPSLKPNSYRLANGKRMMNGRIIL